MMTLNAAHLRAATVRDVDFVAVTRNQLDIEVASQSSAPVPRGADTFRKRLANCPAAPSSGGASDVEFIVCRADDPAREPLGIAGLYAIDRHNGNCEFGVTISSVKARGLGIGFDTHLALVKFGFEHLRMCRMYAHVKADNVRALKTCERLKMTREGILRQHRWKAGEFVDLHLYGLMVDEWDPELLYWRGCEGKGS